MRPADQHSHLLTIPSNRSPLQIVSKAILKPSCPQQQLSQKDNRLIVKMQDTNKLYVREFFQHFFERKSMLEVLSQISNGIQVIQTLVLTFQNSRRLKTNSKLAVKSKINLIGDFPNVVEREGRQISECVEGLYVRLQNIFDQWGSGEQREAEDIPRLFNSEISGDEQLYDMLSSLKQKYSKQKSLREEAESKWRDLQRNVIRLQDQKKRIGQSYKSRDSQLNQLKKKVQELQEHIQILNEQLRQSHKQKEQLTQKLNVLFEINENLANVEKENQELTAKLKFAHQKETKLTAKFDTLQNIVSLKIKQRDDKWMGMIEQKMTSKALFANASCSAFRQFMSSISACNK